MAYLMNVMSIIIAFLTFLASIPTGGLPVASIPKNPVQYDDTIMFVSDFQSSISDLSGTDREDSIYGILDGITNENPGLVVGGGDYQSTFLGAAGTSFGISLLKNAISHKWNYPMEYLFCQGNHDTPKSASLNDTGLYQFSNYSVYLINEDDYPWNEQLDIGIAENKVKATAQKLDNALEGLVTAGNTNPVFVVSHLPLHYSARSNSGDNRYANYIYDAISQNANELNIVYLYGHNHSDTYDDYIGGAINYLAKGDTLLLGGTKEARTLNFVYTNCGYAGYSNNSDSNNSTSTLSATIISVNGNAMSIRKYSKNGLIMSRDVSGATTINAAA